MGTTLTGTTPQDTYDSLIKVTDNGPLSGTLKALSDGLGNDSTLSLSTAAASIAGTLAVAGASTFSSAITMASGGSPRLTLQDTDAGAGNVGILFQESTSPKWTLASVGGDFLFFNEATASNAISVSSTNNVGIGTTAPTQKLTVNGNAAVGGQQAFWLRDDDGFSANAARRAWAITANYSTFGTFSICGASAVDSDPLAGTNFLEITSAGVLSLNQGQIKFPATQVPSADANTLDDYEEGTFSPTIIGTTTAGTATYTQQNGRYTKIGRLVQFEIFIVYSAGTGTGNMDISGLPFTIGGSSYPSFTIGAFDDITLSADNYVLCWGLVGTNQMRLAQMITGGGTQTQVAYDAAGAIQITGTYSV
jgi:hypothetical protein